MQYENMNASVQLIGNRVLFNVTCTASFNIDVLLVLKYLVTVTIKSRWKVKDKQLPGTDKKSHYENMSMRYTAIFHGSKNEHF